MEEENVKSHKGLCAVIIILAVIIVSLETAFLVYTGKYYHRSAEVMANVRPGSYTISATSDGSMVFAPENATTGVVFYPGAKVESSAYAPLMEALANKGVFCVIAKMPYNLAVLDKNEADRIISKYPEIEHWFVAGHSLGGAMAADYASANTDKIEGLVLLAAYSTADLSNSNLRVLSVYGENDTVLDMSKFEQLKQNLPEDTIYAVIDGGNHSYFGSYGEQQGDGKATVTRDEQIDIAVELITKYTAKQ